MADRIGHTDRRRKTFILLSGARLDQDHVTVIVA